MKNAVSLQCLQMLTPTVFKTFYTMGPAKNYLNLGEELDIVLWDTDPEKPVPFLEIFV